jgi:glutamate synthase (ferredoxin)
MIQKHAEYTGSTLALEILEDWENMRPQFVKVMPQDYKRILDALEEAQTEGFEGDDAWLEAFRRGVAAEPAA